jgi:DNA-binding PadR family transcriptional regulator
MKNRGKSRLSPEFALLGFLYQAPGYGYELHQRLRELFSDIWHASQSQTYNILKRLEAQECLTSSLVEQDKLPARQQLFITPKGRERFETWLNEPTNPSVHAIRVEFLTRLYFMQLLFPSRVAATVQAQVDTVKLALEALRQHLTDTPDDQPFNRLALELRVELLTSIVHWLNERVKSIEQSIPHAES